MALPSERSCMHNDNNNSSASGGSSNAFALKVAGWLLPDVRRHLFLLAWVCGVPLHVRYVVHLLRMTAVPLEMFMAEDAAEEWEAPLTTTTAAVAMSDSALRSAALDILFTQVASDCCAANAHVGAARLSTEPWAEVRSLAYGAAEEHAATQIVARDATVRGEVLALVPAHDVALAELEVMYFTALDQARRFEQQHPCGDARHHTPSDGNTRAPAGQQHQRRLGSPVNKDARVDVVVVGSDDEGEGSPEREVVILSDSSSGDGESQARRRRKSAGAVYEVVE
ncbi:hypothetical protein DQ04_00901090 [Trypanosoma grayi]|uniref:hypothetical protein n=1 Tax=Trypanosoma grayi TaxID=71804 RepID=UPI0004F436B8|nr:hypothetical protein DQ04_00901090 [Trypanosoma grayi]KEG13607.1 hypothetical protein DQ04_00901090 [Trypanosoma grayi]